LEDDEIDNDIEPTAMACPVLDHDTGVTLEHRQLRRHPKYKDTWDTSYANEIGRLCQGIGKHPTTPNLQRIAGTNTMKPIQVDNSTAEGYVNNTIITRRLKSLEMRLNWLKCRDSQGQFRIFWDKGSHNLADYHTKHHPPEYHIAHRHTHAG
jgi:hypothetical protein